MQDIRSYIKNDERLLWAGQCANTTTLNKTYKKVFTEKLITSSCIYAVLVVASILLAKHQNVKTPVGFLLLLALLIFIPVINVFTEAGSVSKAGYAATDKRLIVAINGEKDIPYDKITQVAFRTDDDGLTSMLCGTKAVGSKPGSWRSRTMEGNMVSKEDADKPCQNFVFYAVNDPEGLKHVLKDKLSCPIK